MSVPSSHSSWTLALIVVFAAVACGPNTERRRLDFERMQRQQRPSPYGTNAGFANGMAMRTPPRGTISREDTQLDEASATGKVSGAYAMRVPVAITPELLRQGARDFRVYCVPCHGADASGDGTVGVNMQPMPPSLLTDHARGLSPGQLFEIVTSGRRRMPAYGWALPPLDRWSVIAYLRSLQGLER